MYLISQQLQPLDMNGFSSGLSFYAADKQFSAPGSTTLPATLTTSAPNDTCVSCGSNFSLFRKYKLVRFLFSFTSLRLI